MDCKCSHAKLRSTERNFPALRLRKVARDHLLETRRDIRNAVAAGRYRVEDPQLAWRQATHAIVGFSLAVCDKNIMPGKIDEAVVNLFGVVGLDRDEAWEIAKRPCPGLPDE